MTHVGLLMACVAACGVTTVSAFAAGAPESACDSLMPGHHGQNAQSTDSPFRVDVDRTTYTPGDQITVSMVAFGTEKFVGFLLEARVIDENQRLEDFIGSLSPVSGTRHVRGCGPSTLTHSDAHDEFFTNLTVHWTAPVKKAGSVVIRATFVKSFSTFWVDVRSPVIQLSLLVISEQHVDKKTEPHSAGSNETTTAAATTTAPTERPTTEKPEYHTVSAKTVLNSFAGLSQCQNLSLPIKKDIECGRSKGCFVSCDSYSCDYVVKWIPDEKSDSIAFDIVAKVTGTGSQWVAIGFSSDIEMGDDGVVECVADNDIVTVYQSYNYAYYNERRPHPFEGLSKTEGCLRDGILWCRFSRTKKMDEDEVLQKFDLNKEWVVMFANGNARNGEKQMHLLSPRYGPWTSTYPVNFAEPGSFGNGGGNYVLIKLHGCLMIVAWIVAAGVGILAARYYREDWPTVTPFQLKLWFLIHRTCLVSTFILVLVGFFVIYEEADRGFGPISNGRASGTTFDAIHPSLGMATLCLTFVNPVMAIFRPVPDHKRRVLFNWAHRCFGIFTYVVALFTITFGLGMQKAGVSDIGLYVMGGYGLYQCLVAVCLELFHYINNYIYKGTDKSTALPGSDFEHQTLIDKPGNNHTTQEPKFWVWRTTFFVGNCVVLVVVAVFLIILISASGSRR